MLKPEHGLITGLCHFWSQTFPEGKGVETSLPPHSIERGFSSRRPSQKVKVLKLQPLTGRFHLLAQSQTFPEGKGVETLTVAHSTFQYPIGRRPSQKVKVLKPNLPSPTLEGKHSRRPSQKVKVLKLRSLRVQFHCSIDVADLPRR